MKKLIIGTATAAAVLATPAAAHASLTQGTATECTARFVGHPENASPPWALDNFKRTTTIKPADGNTWTVHIADEGHFTTIPGTKSDSGDTIADKVKGSFTGSGAYTVTSATAPHCVHGEHYTGTGDPATSNWPLHYFGGPPATTTSVDPWHWDYTTPCESMSEDSVSGTKGHIAGKVCPTPTPTTPAPTPTDSTPTPSPTTTTPAGEAPVPTPVKSDLPVTG